MGPLKEGKWKLFVKIGVVEVEPHEKGPTLEWKWCSKSCIPYCYIDN